MNARIIFFIKENLEDYTLFLNSVVETLDFKTFVITLEELFSGKFESEIKNRKIFDVFIALENGVAEKNEDAVRSYFKSVTNSPFTNILYIYQDTYTVTETMHSSLRNCFILFTEEKPECQLIQFDLFMNNLFNKAKISFRLSDYIYQSFKSVVYSEVLKKKTQEIERLNRELERRNKIDTLTNLYNRSALFEFLEKERDRTLESLEKLGITDPKEQEDTGKTPVKIGIPPSYTQDFIQENLTIFSVMMVDIDKFKSINDTYGHLVGDIVLKTTGDIFNRRDILREHDIVGRFGGEEFIIILPGTSTEQAKDPALRLLEELENQRFESSLGPFKVTMSIGISEFHPGDESNDDIVLRADKALYYAKQHGRNQVILYEEQFKDEMEDDDDF